MSINMYDIALEFIKIAHEGQVDKAGKEYYIHPLTVSLILPRKYFEIGGVVALLHDVLEDTKYTAENLLEMGFTKEVVDAVVLVSRLDKSITYIDWIRKIKESGNEIAIQVKIADLQHNSDPSRIFPGTEKLLKRYKHALEILMT